MDQKVSKETNGSRYPLFLSTRFSVYIMIFFTSMLQYAGRFALNMSIVCMVVPAQHQHNNDSALEANKTMGSLNYTTLKSSCEQSFSKKDFGFEGEFYWSRPQVGYILAAFFYAYIPMQIMAGWLADKFGIRHVLGTGMLIGGALSLLTPLAARLHYGLLIALRLVMGIAMGVMFPCVHSSVGKWVPPSEKSTFIGFIFTGPSAGTIISFVLSGYLCKFSWTIVFYLLGCVTFLWYIAFLYVVYSSPDEHPRISAEEKEYIKRSNQTIKKASYKPAKIPWRSMLTSGSVLGMCVAQFANGWLMYTLSTGMPLYLQDVMYFNIKENGMLSSLPKLFTVIGSLCFGVLCDVIHRRIITSRRILRKSSESLLAIVVITCSVVISYMNCNQKIEAVSLLCLIYLASCFKIGGLSCSPSDTAPHMAGLVYGLVNFTGNFSGLLSPIAIGNLTRNGTQAEWQRVFFLGAGIKVVGWLSFLFLVGSEEEPWAREQNVTAETEDNGDENDLEMRVNLEKNEHE